MLTSVLVLGSVVLYLGSALLAFSLVRVLRARREAFFLGGAIALLVADRIVHLFDVFGAADPSVGFASVEFMAALLLFIGMYLVPGTLRGLLGVGAPEERVRFLLQSGDDAVLILDAGATRVLACNTHAAELVGRAQERLEGMAPMEVGPELTPDLLDTLLAPLRSGRAPWVRTETVFRRRDGSTWPVGLHIQWGSFGAKEVLVLVAVDLTGRKAAEEEARLSRQRLEDAQEVAQLATWEWDLETGRLSWSDELFRIFGVEAGSFEPRFEVILERMHPDDREQVQRTVEEARAAGRGFDTEYRIHRPGGEPRWVHVTARMELADDGSPRRFMGVSQDITRLRQAEAAVSAAAVRYRRLFEQAPVSLWEEDVSEVVRRLDALKAQGVTDLAEYLDRHPEEVTEMAALVRVLDVNPATLDLYGVESREAFLGPLRIPPTRENLEGLKEILAGLYHGRSHLQLPSRRIGLDGGERSLVVTMNLPSRPEDGNVALVSEVDITDRLASAEALRAREEELSSALDAARMGIWHWDMASGEVVWTEEVYRIFGEASATFQGTIESYMALLHPDDLATIQADIEAAIASGGDYRTEVRVRPDADGKVRWMAGAGRVEFGEDGAPVALHGLVWDVTEQRTAEQALRETEARLAWVVEHAPVIVFAMDADGVFTLSEGQALAALGLASGEVVGRPVWEVYRDVPAVLDDVRRALAGEEAVNILRLPGVVFDVRYHPARDPSGQVTGVIGIATDITGIVQAEAEHAKLVALVEGTQDFVGLVSLEGRPMYANPAGMALLGVGTGWLEEVTVDDVLVRRELFREEVLPALTTEGQWRREVEVRKVDTGEVVPCFANVFLIRDPVADHPLAVAVLLRDLREEKEAQRDRERMERQLRQAQKMETIGTLAGGIAHDFNNLLTPILGYAHMMQEEVEEGSPAREDLEEIVHAASRAKDLVQQILSFSRQKEQDLQVVDVAPVLREASRLLRATIPSAIEVRQRIEEGCGWVRGDPTQLHQVILNLATNSLHAMRDRNGVLGLELSEVEVDDVFVLAHPDLAPGPHLRLTVSDTGTGMSPEVLDRVLEPFFTTKEAGQGTGLGLSVVHGIVTAHKGAMTLYSEVGAGTTVNVYLPVADRVAGGLVSGQEDVGSSGRHRVLVVDDRADIASLVRRMLHALGHEAETAFGSPEALARVQAQPEHFDLLVTDFSMPDMSGLELVREVRKLRPDMPVVLASGFSENLTPERLEEEGVGAFLMKPFVAKELARALERAMGTSVPGPRGGGQPE